MQDILKCLVDINLIESYLILVNLLMYKILAIWTEPK